MTVTLQDFRRTRDHAPLGISTALALAVAEARAKLVFANAAVRDDMKLSTGVPIEEMERGSGATP